MFGRIEGFPLLDFRAIVLILSCVLVATTDLLWGKIYNVLVVVLMTFGLGFAVIHFGIPGITSSLLGMGLGLILYGWMFALGVMGGGDLKFLMALGVLGGPKFVFEVALLAILLGGVLAVGLLLASGRLLPFIKQIYSSMLSLLVKELEFIPPRIDRNRTMPFGVPLALAGIVIWAMGGLA